ncbi:hypothetical protein L3Q82_014768 [Scortum barcoo]|uniref:Uncharacterized protein n=1 Tax=Scortum barcoo TaxID=214431 RepID=A0ACB8VS71_9TELE|nr:hypothetical protein L3Q82_014768 [Scortum barcoo]
MACGVHLRILLIFLVQAEHVCCSWATQAQCFQKQTGNTYVGSNQQDSGLRLGGSYLQNQLRQSGSSGSAQSSSLSTQTALSSGYSQGLSNSRNTQTVSQLAQSGYPSVRLVQDSLVLKPNWQMESNQASIQNVPKKQFSLSTAIATGSPVKQNNPFDVSKMRTWPVQQGTLRASKYQSSSSASVQTPRKSYSLNSASDQPGALKTLRAAADYSRGDYAPSKPSTLSSPLNERAGKGHSQTKVGKPYRSKLFPVTEANAQGSYSQSLQVSGRHIAPARFQPYSLQKPTNWRFSYKLPSTEQIPSNSLQTSWNGRTSAQGDGNLLASGSSRAGTSDVQFAPSRTYSIPQHFGGFAIRRLGDPDNQKEAASIRKPHQTYLTPSQQPEPLKPQVQGVYPESKWMRVRPCRGSVTGAS